MAKNAIFSVIANNYLPRARTLMHSLEKHAYMADRFIVICDSFSKKSVAIESCEIINLGDIEIPDLEGMRFKYNVVEFCTSLKPFIFQHLFNKAKYVNVVYLDPDIYVYQSFDTIFNLVETNSVVVTPHITKPYTDSSRPNSQDINRVGRYNLGFLGLKIGERSRRLLELWGEELVDNCIVDPDNGLFVDQKWFDKVLQYIPDTFIQNNPGWNVAYWNLHYRRVNFRGHKYFVNGVPLIFFHFSGFQPEKRIFSIHQDRFKYKSLPTTIRGLCDNYAKKLNENSFESDVTEYGNGVFNDGTPILDIMRRAYRENLEKSKYTPNIKHNSFKYWLFEHLNQSVEVDGLQNNLISRIVYQVYKSRRDLQLDLPNPLQSDAIKLAQWYVEAARSVFALPEELVNPIFLKLKQHTIGQSSYYRSSIHGIYHRLPKVLRECLIFCTSQSFRTKLRKRLLW